MCSEMTVLRNDISEHVLSCATSVNPARARAADAHRAIFTVRTVTVHTYIHRLFSRATYSNTSAMRRVRTTSQSPARRAGDADGPRPHARVRVSMCLTAHARDGLHARSARTTVPTAVARGRDADATSAQCCVHVARASHRVRSRALVIDVWQHSLGVSPTVG